MWVNVCDVARVQAAVPPALCDRISDPSWHLAEADLAAKLRLSRAAGFVGCGAAVRWEPLVFAARRVLRLRDRLWEALQYMYIDKTCRCVLAP